MSALLRFNLALRALMETGVVLGPGYWGWHVGRSTVTKVLLALAVPAAGFGFWGAVDFRGAGRAAEGLRVVRPARHGAGRASDPRRRGPGARVTAPRLRPRSGL